MIKDMSTRKVKDAKDLETNELIYFKGHAKATYMSDGRSVEEAINDVGNSGITTETDPIFSASAAAKITDGNISAWNGKQDKITDLEAIRSGAAKGATAIQQHQSLDGYTKDADLASVAKSGSYNDLSNKPTIPSAVTEATVSGWGFTKNQGTYVKPSSGIPVSDLEGPAQESIGKGAEAYGFMTQLNTAINGKQDKIADLDAIRSGASKGSTALQPQNGGSGNKFLADDNTYKEINIPEGDFATKTELDEKQDKVIVVDHGTDDTTFVLTPNVLHKWGEVASLTLTLATPEDSTIVNYYMAEFVSGATATTLTMPDSIVWQSELAIEAGKTYQISIVDNLGVIGGW